MRYIIVLTLLLAGCSTTVPVKVKFPELPSELAVQCGPLKKVNDDAKLSDISKTIVKLHNLPRLCSH